MNELGLIQDLAIVLLAAGAAGIICRRLGLSVIVGYLVAGMVVGPFTPPFSLVLDVGRIQTLSQIGLVFLMFGIGLGLSLGKLKRMGAPTLLATGLGAFFMLNATQLLGRVAGWDFNRSLFIAAMFMVSSSAVIAKVLGELNLMHDRAGQVALSMTVLEDVVAVVMLTILVSHTGGGSANVGTLLTGMSAFVVLLVMAGLLMVPKMLRRLEARADPEIQTIIVAGMLFLLAIIAAKVGYSLALGAFLLGAIVAEIPQRMSVEKAFAGMRDLFSSVFFVSIGMMIEVHLLVGVWTWILGLGLFVLVARPLATGLALILCGTKPHEARRAGLLLSPLGEFSFIIAQLGVEAGVLPKPYYPLAVGVSIFTVLAMPILNRFGEPIISWAERVEPRWVSKTFEAYHGWLAHVQTSASGSIAWKLVHGRLVQVAMEMLFITGMMTFSRQMLDLVVGQASAFDANPGTIEYIFWSAVTLVVLIPLVAIWRNVAAFSMIFAEGLGTAWVPPAAVQSAVKAIAALILGYWLYLIVPAEQFGWWGWLAIAVIAMVVVAIFSNRLIYWHSQWQSSVREVLEEDHADVLAASADRVRAQRERDLKDWKVRLSDCIIPDGASCGGRTLAELSIPDRFGCVVWEVERNGIVITAIRPDFRVYPGDKLLLLGHNEKLRMLRRFLAGNGPGHNQSEGFNLSVLETFRIPDGMGGGRTLAELQVGPRTGVRVVGIRRGEIEIIAPSGQERLQGGDDVLVAGTLAAIGEFRRWLSPSK